MLRGLIHALRSRIALKLTLTLVGFVAISLIAAGLYLSRALERVALEVLESRLTVAARVLHDDAVAAVQPDASPRTIQAFLERAARATGMRVSLIALDGRVVADSAAGFSRKLPAPSWSRSKFSTCWRNSGCRAQASSR